MRKILALMFMLSFINAEASEYKLFEIPRTQVVPIQNSDSGGEYELYLKLPKDYSVNKESKYPVIYFTDAVWHIEILSAATEFLMEEVILVGISWRKDTGEDLRKEYGNHVSRFSDYSFWKKNNPDHPKLRFGQASDHLAFIRNDIFSFIEKNYRTDQNNRSYFGYSLGGLFGAYILMAQPDTFKNYILGSPSVQLLTEYESEVEFNKEKLDANVFISHGSLEEKLVEPVSEFATSLKARSDKHSSIEQAVIDGSHQTAFPITGVQSVTWLANLINDKE